MRGQGSAMCASGKNGKSKRKGAYAHHAPELKGQKVASANFVRITKFAEEPPFLPVSLQYIISVALRVFFIKVVYRGLNMHEEVMLT